MTAYGITGLSTAITGNDHEHHGPYPTEAAAEHALAELRAAGLIHRTHSTIFQLPDEDHAA